MKSRPLENFGAVLGLGVFLYLLTMPSVTTRFVDFPVYYEAGLKAVAGRTVYDVPGHFQYKYSPLFAWLFGQISSGTDLAHAGKVAHHVSLISILALFLFWARALASSFGLQRWTQAWKLALTGFAIFLGALKLELQLGQVNFIPLGLLTAFCLLYPNSDSTRSRKLGRFILCSVILSVAIQTKLFCVVLLFIPLLRKDGAFFAIFPGVFYLLLWPALSLIHGSTFAHQEIQAWFSSLFSSTTDLLAEPRNVSVLGFLSKLLGSASWGATLIWLMAGAGVAAHWFVLDRRMRENAELRFVALSHATAVIVLFNPLVWSYWVWFLGPLALVALDRLAVRWGTLLGAAVVVASFHMQHSELNWNYGLVGAITAVCVASLTTLGNSAVKSKD